MAAHAAKEDARTQRRSRLLTCKNTQIRASKLYTRAAAAAAASKIQDQCGDLDHAHGDETGGSRCSDSMLHRISMVSNKFSIILSQTNESLSSRKHDWQRVGCRLPGDFRRKQL